MNIDAQTLAILLLILRIIAVGLIGAVLYRQVTNMRTKHTDYPVVRFTIFALTLTLMIGQLVPITLDAVVTLSDNFIGRHRNPNLLSTSYALNNAIKDVVIGALLCFLHYRPYSNKR